MLIDSLRLRPTLQENTGKSPEVMEDKHRFKVKVEKKKKRFQLQFLKAPTVRLSNFNTIPTTRSVRGKGPAAHQLLFNCRDPQEP